MSRRHAAKNISNSPNGNDDARNATTHHGYNANDFLEDSSSSNNDDDNNDLTFLAPLPNFHMLFQQAFASTETTPSTAMGDYSTTSHHRQQEQEVLLLLKNHDDYLRPFISALLVSCRVLRLSMETTFTAACLLHRFAIARSSSSSTAIRLKNQPKTLHHHDKKNDNDDETNIDDWRWIIASCIFLACKVEEEPRRLRDLINMAHMISFQNDNNDCSSDIDALRVEENVTSSSSSSSPVAAAASAVLYWESDPPDLDTRYWQAKETLVQAEQNVLRWLAFDVTVSHPHRAVVLLLLSQQKQQQQQQDDPENASSTTGDIMIQQRSVSSLPADAATGTLMRMPVNEMRHHETQQEQCQNNMHHDLAHLAWTLLNNTVFYVEALRYDVVSLATAAIEMAHEQQQSQATRTGTAAANDDPVKHEDICNKETDRAAARPFKKLKSENSKDENDARSAVASARQSLHEALARVQRLSATPTTMTTSQSTYTVTMVITA